MGSIFKPKPPSKTAAQIEQEKKSARAEAAEAERKKASEAAAKEHEDKVARGVIGNRSLFGNPGGRGFYS